MDKGEEGCPGPTWGNNNRYTDLYYYPDTVPPI